MRFTFLFKIASLTLWRSWRASVVLLFMVISAVAALVFLSALAVGTNDAMIRNSTGLFSGQIAGTGIQELETHRLQIPGVKQVLIRRQLEILLGNGESLESLVLMGVDPAQEKAATAYWQKTVAGTYPATGEETIFISQDTAKRLKLAIGDTVNLLNLKGFPLKKLAVAGIFKTGISHLDQGLAFCPTQALPTGETALSVAVFLQADTPVESIVTQYRQILPLASVSAWTDFMPDLKQLIDLDSVCMAIVITLVFAIVSVGISCTFLIFTLKNLREHGIMKAMGLLPGDTALLLVTQIGLLTVFAAAIGTLAGFLTVAIFSRTGIDISAFTSHNQYFSVSGILYPRLTGLALLTPPLVAILFGMAATIWPTIYIIRKNPADILRSV